MAGRALDILAHEDRRKAMGQAARQKAVTAFSLERIVPQYEAVYRRVLAVR
jgi:glycosyltransferase involved in cell wall biosynthesis